MAWFAVGAAAAMLAVIMGMLVNGLTAFFVPMEQAEGWARADIAGINSFGLIGLAFGSVAMGYVADRLSIRAVCLIAASTTGICLVVASQAESLWMLYVLFVLAGALGGGTLFAPIFACVGNWFPKAAGVAIGAAAAGQAVGQGGVPFLAAYLIESFGWRGAMLALGCGTLAILLRRCHCEPGGRRPSPRDPRPEPHLRDRRRPPHSRQGEPARPGLAELSPLKRSAPWAAAASRASRRIRSQAPPPRGSAVWKKTKR